MRGSVPDAGRDDLLPSVQFVGAGLRDMKRATLERSDDWQLHVLDPQCEPEPADLVPAHPGALIA